MTVLNFKKLRKYDFQSKIGDELVLSKAVLSSQLTDFFQSNGHKQCHIYVNHTDAIFIVIYPIRQIEIKSMLTIFKSYKK